MYINYVDYCFQNEFQECWVEYVVIGEGVQMILDRLLNSFYKGQFLRGFLCV